MTERVSFHELKTWPKPFHAVMRGEKLFELRRDDRDFQLGDTLLLKEYDPINRQYTGSEVGVMVTYILKEFEGLKEGFCIMGIM